MNRLTIVPRGLAEMLELYGDPRGADGNVDPTWYAKSTAVYRLPQPMHTWNGRETSVFRAHVLVGGVIESVMDEIASRMGEAFDEWDFWGGCWWYRPMRGYDALSTHAWGIAFDLNPDRCPLGGLPTDQHPVIAQTCKEAGFVWGGDWHSPWRNDAMHFQAASSY